MTRREKYCGLYGIFNIANGKVYIGQSLDIKKRCADHLWKLNKNRHGNIKLNEEWNKYGAKQFEFRIIEICIEREINDREQFWIKHYDSINPTFGYNLQSGGSSGRPTPEVLKKMSKSMMGKNVGNKHSLESRKKMSIARKGVKKDAEWRANMSKAKMGHPVSEETKKKIAATRKLRNIPNPWQGRKHTEATKLKMSKDRKGRVPWNKGKKHSPEARAKISEAQKGRIPWNKGKKCSPQTRAKISKANTGKKHTPETRAKISKALIGRVPGNKGKKHSDEVKMKMSISGKKRIKRENRTRNKKGQFVKKITST